MSKARADGRRRAKDEDHETALAGSDSAPDLFKRLRKSGMSPLQVGKVAAELQVLALAVESKEDSQAHATESPLLGQTGMMDPSTPVATLSEVLAKTCEVRNDDPVVVTGRRAAKSKAKGRSNVTKSKEKAEDLAQALYKGLREGALSEKERWDALDKIIECLAMAKSRNGVKILQLGAMRARGRHHAAADKHYPQVTAAIQEFISTHGPVPVRHIAWGDFSVALIRGKSSQFHVDPRNGLTFSACCSDGTAATRLEYEGGCASTIGRFWTEIKPLQAHKVVAFKERSSISVYLPPSRGYSSCDTGSKGPTQIIL
eukprot:5262091-Amphidinium_carterae.1